MGACGVILVLESCGARQAGRTPWPRQLIPVANRPLVEHAVAELGRAGVDRTIVVAAREMYPDVRNALRDSDRADSVSLLDAPRGAGELQALRLAREELGDSCLVVHRGDSLVGDVLEGETSRLLDGHVDAAILVFDSGTSLPDDLADEPRPFAASKAVPLGIDLLTSRTLDALEGSSGALGAALRRLSSGAGGSGLTIERRTVARAWRLSGGVDGILDGNRLLLDALDADWHPDSLENARIEGRVVVHPTAHVENALLRGPCLIGANTTIRDAYIGPYTSIGSGCLIENVEIEHSIVMTDATLRDVGWRFEHSIVGARAHVRRDFQLPKAVQLCVGDDARIAVS